MGINPLRVLAMDLANRPAAAKLRQVSPARWAVNYAVRCADPVSIPRDAHMLRRVEGPDKFGDTLMAPDKMGAVFLDMEVPCRKCDACLRARAAHWRKRALIELARAPRTWFATFTLSDQALWECTMGARVLATRSRLEWDQLGKDEMFRLKVRALAPELTRHWKRLRKNSQAPLRFMWVAENASKGEREDFGNPHIHAFIHEKAFAMPIRKAVLRGSWRLGFDKYNLVTDERHAWYLCKYIAKQIRCPVRASNGYGKELLLSSTEVKRGSSERMWREKKETSVLDQNEVKTYELSETF